MAKYSVTQSAVTQLLADVKSDRIAIPELQRPFVWDSIKVGSAERIGDFQNG